MLSNRGHGEIAGARMYTFCRCGLLLRLQSLCTMHKNADRAKGLMMVTHMFQMTAFGAICRA